MSSKTATAEAAFKGAGLSEEILEFAGLGLWNDFKKMNTGSVQLSFQEILGRQDTNVQAL